MPRPGDQAPGFTIGVLGAAKIVKEALLAPAAIVDGVEVDAIAARNVGRAEAYAAEHGIARVLPSYEHVLDDPGIDAVYLPAPSALHGYWMRRALDAGKHVLCEKPFTANAGESAEIAELAEDTGLVVMEAFHSRHHPMWTRLTEIVGSGALGEIHEASARFCVTHLDAGAIQWQRELGGGALLDLGCYPVHLLRFLFGEPRVTAARARDIDGVDASMKAELAFPGSVSGHVEASMWAEDARGAELRVTGSAGVLHVRMPYHPHFHGLITLTTEEEVLTEPGNPRTTYSFQLERFRDAVRDGAPVVTDAREATARMHVIDAIYRAAGMQPREPLNPENPSAT
ncbi:gfo/Idh/MocA family oxidoreductase [Amycolatopsis balhimycina DSM 5908]|uniref:Gfo/Idh/MocA family oxidoreductase n=2 Tax=Amycolatopsis balhimycina TaxID=208443 RepID=A0A428WJC9_AMYBA|nr:gfo/Idh/MocA family oxidoreductase [Amycolatopsis balhimycina DSM 5908]